MKRLLLGYALLLLTGFSMVGCVYRPGYTDPCTGLCYGGMWEPICGGLFDPFGLWCGCLNPDPFDIDDDDGCGLYSYGNSCQTACHCSACTTAVPGPLVPSYPHAHAHAAGCDCGPQSIYSPSVPYAEPMPMMYGPIESAPIPMEAAPIEQTAPPPAPPASTSYYPPQLPMMTAPQSTVPASMAPVRDARRQAYVPSRL